MMAITSGINEETYLPALSGENTKVSANSSQDLQNQFLTMLVAQLKNQDPTHPMDNSQLTTQLAQINTLSGIEKLNTMLGSISGQIKAGQSLQSSTLIGHGVMIKGDQVLIGKGTATPFGLELKTASTSTTVSIKDASGKVVKTFNMGKMEAGVHSFSWDGKLEDGTKAPDGKYSISISASNATGQIPVQPLNYAYVSGVTTVNNTSKLNIGSMGQINLDEVKQIL